MDNTSTRIVRKYEDRRLLNEISETLRKSHRIIGKLKITIYTVDGRTSISLEIRDQICQSEVGRRRLTAGLTDKISLDDESRYRSNHISSINSTLDPMVGQEMPCHHVPCVDCEQCGTKSERTPVVRHRHVRSGLYGQSQDYKELSECREQ